MDYKRFCEQEGAYRHDYPQPARSLNTFSLEMAEELDAPLGGDKDSDVYVVILKGAGKGFCAGSM